MSDDLTFDWQYTGMPVVRPVVVTGIFDLLHVGHLRFLTLAGDAGPVLVGVESDRRARAWKGDGRPVNTADERAELIAGLSAVHAVFEVDGPPEITDWQAYATLLTPLHPGTLAFTKGDPHTAAKRQAADLLEAAVLEIPPVPLRSTTGLIDQFGDPEAP